MKFLRKSAKSTFRYTYFSFKFFEVVRGTAKPFLLHAQTIFLNFFLLKKNLYFGILSKPFGLKFSTLDLGLAFEIISFCISKWLNYQKKNLNFSKFILTKKASFELEIRIIISYYKFKKKRKIRKF